MPVILRSDEFGLWRDRQIYEAEKLKSLFAPYPTERLEAYQVSTLISSSSNNSPECIEPVQQATHRSAHPQKKPDAGVIIVRLLLTDYGSWVSQITGSEAKTSV